MVLDLHGWTGSAQKQTHESGWKQLGNNEKFVVVWPDGMDDSPSKMGSWNCSMTTGKAIQKKICINQTSNQLAIKRTAVVSGIEIEISTKTIE